MVSAISTGLLTRTIISVTWWPVHLPGDNNRLLADSLTNVNLFSRHSQYSVQTATTLLRDSSYVLDNP